VSALLRGGRGPAQVAVPINSASTHKHTRRSWPHGVRHYWAPPVSNLTQRTQSSQHPHGLTAPPSRRTRPAHTAMSRSLARCPLRTPLARAKQSPPWPRTRHGVTQSPNNHQNCVLEKGVLPLGEIRQYFFRDWRGAFPGKNGEHPPQHEFEAPGSSRLQTPRGLGYSRLPIFGSTF
jgi:hypothetical protein